MEKTLQACRQFATLQTVRLGRQPQQISMRPVAATASQLYGCRRSACSLLLAHSSPVQQEIDLRCGLLQMGMCGQADLLQVCRYLVWLGTVGTDVWPAQ